MSVCSLADSASLLRILLNPGWMDGVKMVDAKLCQVYKCYHNGFFMVKKLHTNIVQLLFLKELFRKMTNKRTPTTAIGDTP